MPSAKGKKNQTPITNLKENKIKKINLKAKYTESESNSQSPIICEVCLHTDNRTDELFRLHATNHILQANDDTKLKEYVQNCQFEAEVTDFWQFSRIGHVILKDKKSSRLIQCLHDSCRKYMLSDDVSSHLIKTGHKISGNYDQLKRNHIACAVCGKGHHGCVNLIGDVEKHAKMHVQQYLQHIAKCKSAFSSNGYNETFDIKLFDAFGCRLAVIFAPDDSNRSLIACKECDLVTTADRTSDHRRRKKHSIICFKHAMYSKSSSNLSPRVCCEYTLRIDCIDILDAVEDKLGSADDEEVEEEPNTSFSAPQATSETVDHAIEDCINNANNQVMLTLFSNFSPGKDKKAAENTTECSVCDAHIKGCTGWLQHAQHHLRKYLGIGRRRRLSSSIENLAVIVDINDKKDYKLGRIFVNLGNKDANNYLVACDSCKMVLNCQELPNHKLKDCKKVDVLMEIDDESINCNNDTTNTIEKSAEINDVDQMITNVNISDEIEGDLIDLVEDQLSENETSKRAVAFDVEDINLNNHRDIYNNFIDLSSDSDSNNDDAANVSSSNVIAANQRIAASNNADADLNQDDVFECSKCLRNVLVTELDSHAQSCRPKRHNLTRVALSNASGRSFNQSCAIKKPAKVEQVYIDCSIDLENVKESVHCVIPCYDWMSVKVSFPK